MNHTDFIPHGVCLLWTVPLVVAIIVGELAIAVIYYLIPLELYRAANRGRVALTKTARSVLIEFALFTLFCGTGHAITVLLLWHPWYWFSAIWTLGTAVISCKVAYKIRGRMDLYISLLAEPANYALLIDELNVCKRRIIELEGKDDGGTTTGTVNY